MLIDKINDNPEKKKLINKIDTFDSIYCYGFNNSTIELLNHFSIKGIIDDFGSINNYLNIPIFLSNDKEIDKNSLIISCSLSMYPKSTIVKLRSNNFKNIVSVLDISKYSNINLEIPFMSNAKKDLELNIDYYEKVYSKLKEFKSKQVFKDIVNFRNNFDLSYMKDYKVDEMGQYFEDFLDLQEGEVFVDAGGFDGQTSIQFIKHCPKYKSIYIFEPDSDNLDLAKNNLVNFKNVNFISKGLSNQKDTLRFDTGSGSASSISENGSIEIEVDTLDNLVKEKVSFIKMDIEGAEGLAIEGMKNHILNDHPKMAISVYHKVDDFWKIPEQIFAIRDDYNIYMRHYTEGTDETIMFFIPNKLQLKIN